MSTKLRIKIKLAHLKVHIQAETLRGQACLKHLTRVVLGLSFWVWTKVLDKHRFIPFHNIYKFELQVQKIEIGNHLDSGWDLTLFYARGQPQFFQPIKIGQSQTSKSAFCGAKKSFLLYIALVILANFSLHFYRCHPSSTNTVCSNTIFIFFMKL